MRLRACLIRARDYPSGVTGPIETRPKVFVDAKILNMHDATLPKVAYVGYYVEGSGERKVKRVQATESDDAEALAITFAIEELKGALRSFVVVCDHQSVVSEAKRASPKNPSEHLVRLRDLLSDKEIELEALQTNPAHGVLTEYVNALSGG
jgi:hypothetical protein